MWFATLARARTSDWHECGERLFLEDLWWCDMWRILMLAPILPETWLWDRFWPALPCFDLLWTYFALLYLALACFAWLTLPYFSPQSPQLTWSTLAYFPLLSCTSLLPVQLTYLLPGPAYLLLLPGPAYLLLLPGPAYLLLLPGPAYLLLLPGLTTTTTKLLPKPQATNYYRQVTALAKYHYPTFFPLLCPTLLGLVT